MKVLVVLPIESPSICDALLLSAMRSHERGD